MTVPIAPGSAAVEIKKSRFLSRAEYFDSPDAVKPVVQAIRNDHPGCSHVVYAFVVGRSGDNFGMSDDHEPKGTAGRPVLEVLKGSGVTNVLVTVVRFFGGTKLGTGGLVKAYTESAQAAMAALEREELIEKVRYQLSLPYSFYETVKRAIYQIAGTISKEEFAEDVTLFGEIPAEKKQTLSVAVADLSGGGLTPSYDEGSSES